MVYFNIAPPRQAKSPFSSEGTRGVASTQNTKKIGIRSPRLADWQHAARPGPTFRGEIGIDGGDFLNNKRGLLAALVLRDKRELFKVGSDRSPDAEGRLRWTTMIRDAKDCVWCCAVFEK